MRADSTMILGSSGGGHRLLTCGSPTNAAGMGWCQLKLFLLGHEVRGRTRSRFVLGQFCAPYLQHDRLFLELPKEICINF
jgi:hypothetical protein